MRQRRAARRSTADNYILMVFDSCRSDFFQRARSLRLKKLGPVERRWSYAPWRFNLLMGRFPHACPKRVFASEYYTKDFFRSAATGKVAEQVIEDNTKQWSGNHSTDPPLVPRGLLSIAPLTLRISPQPRSISSASPHRNG